MDKKLCLNVNKLKFCNQCEYYNSTTLCNYIISEKKGVITPFKIENKIEKANPYFHNKNNDCKYYKCYDEKPICYFIIVLILVITILLMFL